MHTYIKFKAHTLVIVRILNLETQELVLFQHNLFSRFICFTTTSFVFKIGRTES